MNTDDAAHDERVSDTGTESERSAASGPDLAYRPVDPSDYSPGIGLIGCGAITVEHLKAYSAAGYRVLALCDLNQAAAVERRDEFYPDADVSTDHRKLFARDDIEVVDIATHPRERAVLIREALQAGKHVLSQKPFVLDLEEGKRLAEMAAAMGLKLAVNQNGRWAPHFSYLRQAVLAGLLGEVQTFHASVHWDHNWVCGTEFENVRHLILYDFAIHWFDLLCCVMGDRQPTRVYASMARSATQQARPSLLGQTLVEYPGGQASLIFDGDTRYGERDTTYVTGSEGTLVCSGKDLKTQQVRLFRQQGVYTLALEGTWFPDGFHGSMAELLCSIAEGREPCHSAQNNLQSLALCFAAVASAERHEAVVPNTVSSMPALD